MIGAPGARAATQAWLARPLRRAVRLLLSVLGVAVGVGLLSAVLIQNGSTTRGADRVYDGLAGRARLQLVARGPLGMPEHVLDRVRDLDSVELAVPATHDLVRVETRRGRFDMWLVGVGDGAERLGGTLARFARAGGDGVSMSRAVASKLGVGRRGEVTIRSRAGTRRVEVADVLRDGRFGDVAGAPIVAAPLGRAQELAGNAGRIGRIAVVPHGSTAKARAALRHVVGRHTADVRRVGADARAEAQASSLTRNSSSLFAALSLVVGALLAYASMSLIAAERRREVATLNALGCSARALLLAVLAEALLVGIAGSVLGLVLGRAALSGLLPSPDPLLASVFIVEHSARMTPGVVALSMAAGVVATLAAAAVPARELVRVPPAEALVGEAAPATPARIAGRWLVVAPVVLAVAGAALSLLGQAIVGVGLLVFAGLLAIPAAVPVLARAVRARVRSPGGPALVGIAEVVAFPSRAVALVAVVTLAVCGTTIITGTASDLSSGVGEISASTYKGRSVFVRPRSDGDVFLTQPIDPGLRAVLARRRNIRSMSEWRASFINWNGRRILAFGFDPAKRRDHSPGGFTSGNGRRAAKALVRDPDAVAVSRDIGTGSGLHPGSRLTIPTPRGPRRVRVVANISNYGWAAGAITLNPASAAAWWGRDFVTAFKLRPKRGVGPRELARDLEPMLRRRGLTASTSGEMRAQARSNAHAQLATVSRIGALIALAGVLAVAAAAMLGVLGRARRITSLRTIGMSSRQVASATFSELACIVLMGALVGLAIGIVGRILAVHYLATSVSLPVSLYVSWPQFARPVALVAIIAGVATLLAVRASLRLPLRRALDER